MSNENPQAQSERADVSRLDQAAARAKAVRAERDRKGADREREPVAGGLRLKMEVRGSIPGYHLYWENDQDGAIETLLFEGFEFVEPAEVQMQSAFVQDADLAHRVSRYVGRKEDGSPLRAYLMKCTDEIWRERESARYAQADAWDQAIHESQHGEGRYRPKGTDLSVDTKFRKSF